MMARKGGAGKTTLSVSFAVCANLAGYKVAIIDLDPQGSLSDWSEDRLRYRETEEPVVLCVDEERTLKRCVQLCREHAFDVVVIDTLPGVDPSAAAALAQADYVVIPCQPGKFDMRAIGATVEMVAERRKVGGIVVNQGRPGSRINETTLEKLKAYGLDLCLMPIMKRAVIQDGVLDGGSAVEHEPASLAAVELENFFLWGMSKLGFDRKEVRGRLRKSRQESKLTKRKREK